MSEPTLQELKELILDVSKQVIDLNKQVIDLDKKVETGFVRLEGEIKQVKTELVGEIKRVEEKVNGIDKRLSNEETISRTALGALLVAALTGLVKYLFFTQV